MGESVLGFSMFQRHFEEIPAPQMLRVCLQDTTAACCLSSTSSQRLKPHSAFLTLDFHLSVFTTVCVHMCVRVCACELLLDLVSFRGSPLWPTFVPPVRWDQHMQEWMLGEWLQTRSSEEHSMCPCDSLNWIFASQTKGHMCTSTMNTHEITEVKKKSYQVALFVFVTRSCYAAWLASNSLHRPSWSWACSNPPTSASSVLGVPQYWTCGTIFIYFIWYLIFLKLNDLIT